MIEVKDNTVILHLQGDTTAQQLVKDYVIQHGWHIYNERREPRIANQLRKLLRNVRTDYLIVAYDGTNLEPIKAIGGLAMEYFLSEVGIGELSKQVEPPPSPGIWTFVGRFDVEGHRYWTDCGYEYDESYDFTGKWYLTTEKEYWNLVRPMSGDWTLELDDTFNTEAVRQVLKSAGWNWI